MSTEQHARWVARWDTLDLLEADFDDLDQRFYQLDQQVNITERIADHMASNELAFYLEGLVKIPD